MTKEKGDVAVSFHVHKNIPGTTCMARILLHDDLAVEFLRIFSGRRTAAATRCLAKVVGELAFFNKTQACN